MRRLVAIIQALAISAGLFAQNTNLNPTVQVTNAYENSLKDFEREPLKAEVPDSLYKFDLNFDYSGFDKPYKGNDEFNPFLTELDLVGRSYDGRNFYLKAGAGYTLHPQLDLFWAFPGKGRFKAGLFAEHRSYFGDYVSDGIVPEDVRGGFDSYSKVGFEGRADWNRIWLQTSVWYDGVHSRLDWAEDWRNRKNYNSGSAMLRLATKNSREEYAFKFDLRLEDSFGMEKLELQNPPSGKIRENVLDASLLLGYQMGRSLFGLGADANVLSGSFADDGSKYGGVAVALRPQFRFSGDKVAIEAGVSLLFTGTNNINNTFNAENKEQKFDIWPYLKFKWNVVPDKFQIFADADLMGTPAGERAAWKISHIYLDHEFSLVKTSSANLGFKGTLWKKMQWKLGAGYENIRNANVTGTVAIDGFKLGWGLPSITVLQKLEDFNLFLNLDGRFGIFSLDANLCYRAFLHKEDQPVLPSAFTADLRAKFDIRRRASVYAGVDFRSSRPVGNDYKTPHFVNLYAGADFRLTTKLGLFIEARNLLNRKLPAIPIYSENGFVVTGGIVLNF